MFIIKIEPEESGFHLFQGQSHRTECWEEGYIAVPPELESQVMECMGWCDLTIEDGVLIGITPIPRPDPPEPEPQPASDTEILNILLGVTE